MHQSLRVPYFKEYVGEHADYAAIRSRRKELMSQHIAANGVEKKPKVDELLDYLHAHGYKTAVATATDPERAKQYLTSIGIYEKFDQVVCATMVPHGKPMPDVYLYVCEQIGEKARGVALLLRILIMEYCPHIVQDAT